MMANWFWWSRSTHGGSCHPEHRSTSSRLNLLLWHPLLLSSGIVSSSAVAIATGSLQRSEWKSGEKKKTETWGSEKEIEVRRGEGGREGGRWRRELLGVERRESVPNAFLRLVPGIPGASPGASHLFPPSIPPASSPTPHLTPSVLELRAN